MTGNPLLNIVIVILESSVKTSLKILENIVKIPSFFMDYVQHASLFSFVILIIAIYIFIYIIFKTFSSTIKTLILLFIALLILLLVLI